MGPEGMQRKKKNWYTDNSKLVDCIGVGVLDGWFPIDWFEFKAATDEQQKQGVAVIFVLMCETLELAVKIYPGAYTLAWSPVGFVKWT